MLNYQLKIMGEELVTFVDHSDEFYVNLLFDRFFIDRCAHIWVRYTYQCSAQFNYQQKISNLTFTTYYNGHTMYIVRSLLMFELSRDTSHRLLHPRIK